MQNKQNQRIMLTKRLIQEALLDMLQEKNIGEIYIRELCQKAGINRTTFYNHYKTQYDVMKEITENFLNDINRFLARIPESEGEDSSQHLISAFRYLEDHLLLSRTMLNNIIDPSFSRKLLSLPSIQKMVNRFPEDCDSHLKDLTTSYVLSGCYNLMKEWVNSDDRISIKEEVDIMRMLVRNTYKGLI